MNGDLFSFLPIWAIFVGTLFLVLGSVEAGYRWATYKQQKSDREKEAPVNAIVGATLGFLAFLVAITFGLAADRFDTRKQAVVNETNAILTTFLRADLLAEPNRTEVRKILRQYVDQRLKWAGAEKIDAGPSSKELQQQLWTQAVDIGQKNPDSEVAALFIDSVNQVIELHTKRVIAREQSRIPGKFWMVLYLVAILSLAAMGYHGAVADSNRGPAMLAVAIAFSAVIVLIADIDRPTEGAINESQQAMIDLRDWKSEAKP